MKTCCAQCVLLSGEVVSVTGWVVGSPAEPRKSVSNLRWDEMG